MMVFSGCGGQRSNNEEEEEEEADMASYVDVCIAATVVGTTKQMEIYKRLNNLFHSFSQSCDL
jgi:hypothetical protein